MSMRFLRVSRFRRQSEISDTLVRYCIQSYDYLITNFCIYKLTKADEQSSTLNHAQIVYTITISIKQYIHKIHAPKMLVSLFTSLLHQDQDISAHNCDAATHELPNRHLKPRSYRRISPLLYLAIVIRSSMKIDRSSRQHGRESRADIVYKQDSCNSIARETVSQLSARVPDESSKSIFSKTSRNKFILHFLLIYVQEITSFALLQLFQSAFCMSNNIQNFINESTKHLQALDGEQVL